MSVLMHKKGLALLETGNEDGAREMLKRLAEIDPDALTSSTEIAGLKGRLHWQASERTNSVLELEAARDAYAAAWARNPDSHYMADNVGQLSLLLGDAETAHKAFRKGLEALQKTGDSGYWALATRASCYLGLRQQAEGLEALARVKTADPQPSILESIRRGLIRLHKGVKGTPQDLDLWLSTLAGDAQRKTFVNTIVGSHLQSAGVIGSQLLDRRKLSRIFEQPGERQPIRNPSPGPFPAWSLFLAAPISSVVECCWARAEPSGGVSRAARWLLTLHPDRRFCQPGPRWFVGRSTTNRICLLPLC